jgi:DNA-binding YbaB/EbfC family protein
MKNITQMMKQAQAMQGKMQEIQEKLEEMEVTGESGGGMVKAILSGKGRLRKLSIDPAIVTPDDTEMMEDLIVAAINDAKDKSEAAAKEQMGDLTGGLPLPPGFKLPF